MVASLVVGEFMNQERIGLLLTELIPETSGSNSLGFVPIDQSMGEIAVGTNQTSGARLEAHSRREAP